jgi:uncharacterized membrane protein YagU involved in acid resistance
VDSADAMIATERSGTRAILLGGLVAGTVDIAMACAINKTNPIVILLVIASGLMGKAAFHPRIEVIALGLLLQWAMSILIAAIYVFASRRVSFLQRPWIAGGLGYGVIVFFVMNFVVVPLSAVPRSPPPTVLQLFENLTAMLLFGLIIAFWGRRTLQLRSDAVRA